MKRLEKIKTSILLRLTAATMLPIIGSLLLVWYAFSQYKRSMALSYSIPYAKNMAYMFIIGFLAFFSLYGLYSLWKLILKPLKKLEDDISSFNWGEEFPEETDSETAEEILRLRRTITMLAHDAAENAQLNRRYLSDIIKAQEEVRSNLAREIHDGPLQEITALVQRLRLISLSQSREEAAKRLDEAERVSMFSVRELREVCNNLTPPWLELGLRQSLIELADRRSKLYGINILTTETDEVSLDTEQTLAFFRIAQQALANTAQHADASVVNIRLINGGDFVRMEIEDNGSGFEVPKDLKKVRATGHRGLSNMYERMQLIGGNCEIKSQAGQGTNVICVLKTTASEL
ncbi:MAG: histidine kinase [Synergistaceae bacterium]|nr:histidine kinase [Synergistaceae bacterium]